MMLINYSKKILNNNYYEKTHKPLNFYLHFTIIKFAKD